MTSKRDYEAEIIQALKEKPRDAVALGKDLRIASSKMFTTICKLEDNSAISWDDEKQVWHLSNPS